VLLVHVRDAIGDPAQAPDAQLQSVLASVSDLADSTFFADVDLGSHLLFSAGAMPSEPDALVNSDYVDSLDELTDPLGQLVTPDNV
jgi:hypothetical protein